MIEKDSTCCFYESGSCEDLIRTLAALIGDCQPCPIAKVFSQQARQNFSILEIAIFIIVKEIVRLVLLDKRFNCHFL